MSYEPIESGETEDGYKWAFYPDDGYEYEKNFKIYASQGTTKYIGVDQVIDPEDASIYLQDKKVKLYKPLYMLAHSGVSVSLTGYRDPWDSGQCGFAVLTEEDINYAGIAEEDMERYLEAQVKEYDAVLRGQVYYYHIWRDKHCNECNQESKETIDSLSGIIVWSWKDLEQYIEQDVMKSIEYDRKKRTEAEHAAQKGVQSDD